MQNRQTTSTVRRLILELRVLETGEGQSCRAVYIRESTAEACDVFVFVVMGLRNSGCSVQVRCALV